MTIEELQEMFKTEFKKLTDLLEKQKVEVTELGVTKETTGKEIEKVGKQVEEIQTAMKKASDDLEAKTLVIAKTSEEMDEKISRDDSEVHYNLGIAFFEQGLLEEAIEEFIIASKDKKHALECYSVIGHCYKQKKDFEEGIKWIEKGMKLTESGTYQCLSLKYDLASIYEEMKNKSKALEIYEEINKLDPEYRAVGERINSLKKKPF